MRGRNRRHRICATRQRRAKRKDARGAALPVEVGRLPKWLRKKRSARRPCAALKEAGLLARLDGARRAYCRRSPMGGTQGHLTAAKRHEHRTSAQPWSTSADVGAATRYRPMGRHQRPGAPKVEPPPEVIYRKSRSRVDKSRCEPSEQRATRTIPRRRHATPRGVAEKNRHQGGIRRQPTHRDRRDEMRPDGGGAQRAERRAAAVEGARAAPGDTWGGAAGGCVGRPGVGCQANGEHTTKPNGHYQPMKATYEQPSGRAKTVGLAAAITREAGHRVRGGWTRAGARARCAAWRHETVVGIWTRREEEERGTRRRERKREDEGEKGGEGRRGRGGFFVVKSGGARRDRTADLLHAMQALSQLSYGPTGGAGRYLTRTNSSRK